MLNKEVDIMAKMKRKAFVDKDYCVACGTCVKVCPIQIIKIEQGVFADINYDKCVGCGKCANVCPASVIEVKSVEVNQ